MSIENGEKTCETIIQMGRNNDYTTGNLLDYEYFSRYYKLIETDLSKKKVRKSNFWISTKCCSSCLILKCIVYCSYLVVISWSSIIAVTYFIKLLGFNMATC